MQIILVLVFLQVLLQLLFLVLQRLRQFIVDISEHLVNGRLDDAHRVLERVSHRLLGLLPDLLRVALLDEPPLEHVLLEPLDGTGELGQQLLPLQHLLLISVPLREVAG